MKKKKKKKKLMFSLFDYEERTNDDRNTGKSK